MRTALGFCFATVDKKERWKNMILQKRIPKDFYKLFRTQNMQYYMMFLVALYDENTRAYMSLGLTEQECKNIISETIFKASIQWNIEIDTDMDGLAEAEVENDRELFGGSPTGILSRLVRWGWLKKDFDERLNRYVYSFPEYSQLYVELFQHLQTEDDSRERESILSIYSALYTYHGDREKNNGILKNGVLTCRKLSQLLTNMQDGIRGYFEALSRQKDFIGIQEVLVEELNNSDSKKYAILTTTDSFYRYKEEIKELISKIMIENDTQKEQLYLEKCEQQSGTLPYARLERKLEMCEEAGALVYRLEREFDLMEQKYKKLIEQKSVFAKRALARMHYILQEGNNREDYLMQWIQVLNRSENPEEVLDKTRGKMYFTSQYKLMSDQSFSNRKLQGDTEFSPEVVDKQKGDTQGEMGDYIPKPLYTKRELRAFRQQNMQGGMFVTTEKTVQSMEDLEKLLFLWQEATENINDSMTVELGADIDNETGMTYSRLVMKE